METNLTRLRHIVAIARTGSFSIAAQEEGITQPALSRSIQAFEAQHGVRLFDRGRGGVAITPAGNLVVEQARGILEASRDLDRSLRLFGKGEAGRVTIGFGPLVGSLLLPSLGKALLKSRPNLQIFTMIRSPNQLLDKLLDDSIELLVCNSWQLSDAPGVVQETVARLQLSVVVRSGHPLTGSGEMSMADLAPWPVASAVELPRPGIGTSGGIVSDNFHILRDVTASTDCVWITYSGFIAQDIRDGGLAVLDVADMNYANTEISIASRRGRTHSPATQAVDREIRTLLGVLQEKAPEPALSA